MITFAVTVATPLQFFEIRQRDGPFRGSECALNHWHNRRKETSSVDHEDGLEWTWNAQVEGSALAMLI